MAEDASKLVPTALSPTGSFLDAPQSQIAPQSPINSGGPHSPINSKSGAAGQSHTAQRNPNLFNEPSDMSFSPSPSKDIVNVDSCHLESIGPVESQAQPLRHSMVTRAQAGISKPKVPYIGAAEVLPSHGPQHSSASALVTQINKALDPLEQREPSSVSEALSSSSWKRAMDAEFQALQRNKTWELVPRPNNQKLVDSKWVFKIKYNTDSSIHKHKVRLVAKGFQQVPGVDFGETFSPMVKATTVRLILTLAVTFGWPVQQLDVNNTFLNDYLQEVVFMRQPEGFEDPTKPSHVCKLVKALYRLKQAPRAWFDRLRDTLLKWGFQSSRCYVSLFYLKTSSLTVFVLIYVDDILITGNDLAYLTDFIKNLNDMFSLKDLGSLSYFLGIEVQRTNSGMFLSQAKYITDLLDKFNMANCAAVTTAMVTGRKFTAGDGKLMEDPCLYRKAIGSLQYLTSTRPDIAYSINKLSQFLANPTETHFQGVKRIFQYLQGTKQLGLLIKPVQNFRLVAFTDADWATDTDDRRSTGGMCTYLGDTLLSWSSRKRRVVSRSSAESEYRALADCAAEVKWVVSLLTELGVHLKQPSLILCDNLSAKALASNPVQHARSKHIEIDVHFV